jgi:hypothetical protein
MKKIPNPNIFNPKILFAPAVATFLLLAGIALALLGGNDVNVITGTETYPYITQNNSVVWGHGDTIVIAYYDSRGDGDTPNFNRCGVSVSTDNGETFTRITNPFAATGLCYGDASVFFSRRAGKWFVSFQSATCVSDNGGRTGAGIRSWQSTDGVNWVLGSCIANAGYNFARNSFLLDHSTWVDNNPASPRYGW